MEMNTGTHGEAERPTNGRGRQTLSLRHLLYINRDFGTLNENRRKLLSRVKGRLCKKAKPPGGASSNCPQRTTGMGRTGLWEGRWLAVVEECGLVVVSEELAHNDVIQTYFFSRIFPHFMVVAGWFGGKETQQNRDAALKAQIHRLERPKPELSRTANGGGGDRSLSARSIPCRGQTKKIGAEGTVGSEIRGPAGGWWKKHCS